jgi:hypothetical protein
MCWIAAEFVPCVLIEVRHSMTSCVYRFEDQVKKGKKFLSKFIQQVENGIMNIIACASL